MGLLALRARSGAFSSVVGLSLIAACVDTEPPTEVLSCADTVCSDSAGGSDEGGSRSGRMGTGGTGGQGGFANSGGGSGSSSGDVVSNRSATADRSGGAVDSGLVGPEDGGSFGGSAANGNAQPGGSAVDSGGSGGLGTSGGGNGGTAGSNDPGTASDGGETANSSSGAAAGGDGGALSGWGEFASNDGGATEISNGIAIVDGNSSQLESFALVDGGTGDAASAPLIGCPIFSGQKGTAWRTPNFNTTGAYCFITCDNIDGWNCSNFDGRTAKVNGIAVTCGFMPIAKVEGRYLFEFSAGEDAYSTAAWWGTPKSCSSMSAR